MREYLLNESITWFTWSSEGNFPASMAPRTGVDIFMLKIDVFRIDGGRTIGVGERQAHRH